MSFPWLERTTPQPADGRHAAAATAELSHRAATFFRLGYSQEAATARLTQRVAWEYETKRPEALSDAAVAKIVADTYARRPG